jgi:hypothetical protein
MAYKIKKARFHIKTGPASLFDRVKAKMAGERHLALHAPHAILRASQRNIPLEHFQEFNSKEWELQTAEVNVKSGKFINSAWYRVIDGGGWWIVIGLNDVLMTVIDTNKFGLGNNIIKKGDLFEHVKRVNEKLLRDDSQKNI